MEFSILAIFSMEFISFAGECILGGLRRVHSLEGLLERSSSMLALSNSSWGFCAGIVILGGGGGGPILTLNPKTLNPKPLNPQTLNPQTLRKP